MGMNDDPIIGRWRSGPMDDDPVIGRWRDDPGETDEEREEREFLEYHRKRQRGALLPNIEAGAIQMTSGMAGLAQRVTGGLLGDPEETARYARAAAQAAEEEAAKPGKVLPEWAARGVRSVTGTMPTQVLAGLTGGPPAMIGLATSQEMNQAIFEGKEAGLKGVGLAAHVISQGAVEAIPATIMSKAGRGGFEAIFGRGAPKAVTRGIRAGLKKAGIRTIDELVEENITEVGHNAVSAVFDIDPEAITLGRIGKTVADTTVATLMQMGLAGAPGVARAAMARGEPEAAPGEPQVAPNRAEWLARNRERLMAETRPQAAPEAVQEGEGFTFRDPTQEEREQSAAAGETERAEFMPGVAATEPIPTSEGFSLTKKRGARIRRDLGLPEISEEGVESWPSVMNKVVQERMHEKATDIARKTIAEKRQLSTEESVALLLKADIVEDQRQQVVMERAAAKAKNDKAAYGIATDRMNALIDEMDILTRGSRYGKRENARAMSIGQLVLKKERNDLPSVLAEIQSVIPEGQVISEKTLNQATDWVDNYDTALKDMVAQEETDRIAEEAKEAEIAEKVLSANKPKRRAGKTAREKAVAEREDIKKKIRDMGYQVHDVSGVTIEGTYLIGRLGLTYVKEGAGTLAEVLEQLRADMPQLNLTQSEVNRALIQRSPKYKSRQKSDASRRKSKLLSIAKEQVKVEDLAQDISSEVTGKTAVDPELAKWRKMRRDLERRLGLEEKLKQAQEGIFPERAKKPIESPVTAVINAEISELKKRATWTRKLEQAEKGEFLPEGKKLAKSPEVAKMQKRYRDLLQLKKLTEKVESAERGIFKPKGPRQALEENVKELKRRYTKLANEYYYAEIEADKLERAMTIIHNLQNQLTNGLKNQKSNPRVVSPELAGLHEDARKLRTEIRIDDEIAKIEDQHRTGIYPEPIIKEQKLESRQLQTKRMKLTKLRKEKQQIIADAAPWTAGKVFGEVAGASSAMKTAGDISFVGRQLGPMGMAHPWHAARAFYPAIEAGLDIESSEWIQEVISKHPNSFYYDVSKLAILDVDSPRAVKQAEAYKSKVIENFKIFGRQNPLGIVIAASGRHAVAYGNLMRTQRFDAFLKSAPNATLEEMTAISDWINVFSGIGNLGRAGVATENVQRAFFSLKFSISRIQAPYILYKHWKLPRVRKAIAKDMARFLIPAFSTLAAASALGATVEWWDVDDPDWGKIRIGNTRFDIFHGFQQPARVVARVLTAPLRREQAEWPDPLELLTQFALFKLAPIITTPVEAFRGKTAVGEERTLTSTMAHSVVNLAIEDIVDAYRDEESAGVLPVAPAVFLGIGASTYQDSETVTRKKFKKLWQAGQITKARQLRYRWNQANPDDKIVTVKVGGAPRK